MNTWYHCVVDFDLAVASPTFTVNIYDEFAVAQITPVTGSAAGITALNAFQGMTGISGMTPADAIAWYDVIDFLPLAPTACAQALAVGYGLEGDLNDDCVIDELDLMKITDDWLRCIDPADERCE